MTPRVSKAAMKGRNFTILIEPYVLQVVLSLECLGRTGNAEDEHDNESAKI